LHKAITALGQLARLWTLIGIVAIAIVANFARVFDAIAAGLVALAVRRATIPIDRVVVFAGLARIEIVIATTFDPTARAAAIAGFVATVIALFANVDIKDVVTAVIGNLNLALCVATISRIGVAVVALLHRRRVDKEIATHTWAFGIGPRVTVLAAVCGCTGNTEEGQK
jgi:hypothetical protein